MSQSLCWAKNHYGTRLLDEVFDQNVHRKDFLPSETVAIAKALEPQEKKAAKERQAKAGPIKGKGKKSGSGKLPEAVKGQTRDKLARYAGVSGKTLEKAKAVVEAAEAEPEKYGPLVEEMDRTRS